MKKLTQKQFLAISRDIKGETGGKPKLLKPATKEAVAMKHGVSVETVRIVNLTKTWPGFVQYKKDIAANKARIKANLAAAKRRAEARAAARSKSEANPKRVELPFNDQGIPMMTRRFHDVDAGKKSDHDRLVDLEIEVGRLKRQIPRTFMERLFGRLD